MISWRVADVGARVEIARERGRRTMIDWLGRVFDFELDLFGILCLSFSVRWPRFQARKREPRMAFRDELWFRREDHSTQQLIQNVAAESCWLVFHGKVEPFAGVPIPGLREPPADWRLN